MAVLSTLELLAMGSVVNHRLDDLEGHVADVLHRDSLIVVLASLHRGEGRLSGLSLFLALFE